MGVSYSARALIGCRFSGREIFAKKQVKAFEHSHGDDVNFDPKTGHALWREVDVCLLDALEDLSAIGSPASACRRRSLSC